MAIKWLIDASYFVAAVLFILGLKGMSSPVTARKGIVWAGAGMLVATLITFLYPGMSNYELILAAIVVGSAIAWWSGKRVAMTDMPQMIALYNGMGGGAAAAIAAVELYKATIGDAANASSEPQMSATVGLLVMRSYILAGNTAHYDGVIAALEARGLAVVTAFASVDSAIDAIRPALRPDASWSIQATAYSLSASAASARSKYSARSRNGVTFSSTSSASTRISRIDALRIRPVSPMPPIVAS